MHKSFKLKASTIFAGDCSIIEMNSFEYFEYLEYNNIEIFISSIFISVVSTFSH
jgi:hypothetical protein